MTTGGKGKNSAVTQIDMMKDQQNGDKEIATFKRTNACIHKGLSVYLSYDFLLSLYFVEQAFLCYGLIFIISIHVL